MPQPFPKSITSFQLHLGQACEERPVLALFAAKIISAWAVLESTMAMVFNSIIPGDPTLAASIFGAIRNPNAQRDAFGALADRVLTDEEERDILDGLLRRYTGAGKSRDVVAHHLWATIPEIPDAILMTDPKSMAGSHVLLQGSTATGTFSNEKAMEMINLLRNSVSVWKVQDFVDCHDRITRTTVMATSFMIMMPNPQRPSRDEKARQQLLSDPEIGEHVRRCAQNRKKSQ